MRTGVSRAALVAVALTLLSPAMGGPAGAATRYDIVLIVTDDQPWHTIQYMPMVNLHIRNVGVGFRAAFASTPLCCPSRASIFTGLYTHNHGVLRNHAPEGGATKFDDTSTIATWLAGVGYRTGLFGRYMNEYAKLEPYPYIPPGWSEWYALPAQGYYDYDLVENGAVVRYGSNPEDYGTNVLAAKAVQFIETTPAGTPLFLYFAPYAPHEPATPAPGDEGSFSWLAPWRPPSYNEADVSDKPRWVRELPLLTSEQQANGDAFHRKQVETLQAVDRAVASIVDALTRTGRLANAAIIYTADHGLSWGEQRWLDKKDCVYEACVRVPFLVRAPGNRVRIDNRLVLNIDLAPTIAEWAGVVPPTAVNGLSFARLLSDPATPWRNEVLLEDLGRAGKTNFYAVRTRRYLYAEYDNGDRELYDLRIDPYQLSNVVSDPIYAPVVAQLDALLDALKSQ